MTNLVRLDVGPKAPADLSRNLRDIADAIDRGEVTALVAGLLYKGSYEFVYGASYSEALELATLLQHRCIREVQSMNLRRFGQEDHRFVTLDAAVAEVARNIALRDQIRDLMDRCIKISEGIKGEPAVVGIGLTLEQMRFIRKEI